MELVQCGKCCVMFQTNTKTTTKKFWILKIFTRSFVGRLCLLLEEVLFCPPEHRCFALTIGLKKQERFYSSLYVLISNAYRSHAGVSNLLQ